VGHLVYVGGVEMIYERRMATRVPPNAVAADAIDARRVHMDLVLLVALSTRYFFPGAGSTPTRKRQCLYVDASMIETRHEYL